jgi:hypothetical protein
MPLIRRSKRGKILYAVAYENPNPGIRYLLARNERDAKTQAKNSHLGHIVAVGPAIGVFGQHEERKRIYSIGF